MGSTYIGAKESSLMATCGTLDPSFWGSGFSVLSMVLIPSFAPLHTRSFQGSHNSAKKCLRPVLGLRRLCAYGRQGREKDTRHEPQQRSCSIAPGATKGDTKNFRLQLI